MKELLKAITIGHIGISKEKRMESKKIIKRIQKMVNKRLK